MIRLKMFRMLSLSGLHRIGLLKNINLAQALQSLKSLAGQLGLPGGLDAWERLSRQMGENEGSAGA